MGECWIDGKFVPEEQAAVSIRDLGLLHAAGVFTTLRARGGRPVRLAAHLARLRDSCAALSIPLQPADAELESVVTQLLERNGLADARLRITVTRGVAETDPLHGLVARPTLFMTAVGFEPYPQAYYQKGLTAVLVDDQKLNPFDVQAGHKTLNYYSRLSALREAGRRGGGEALWFNVFNMLQSGSISNVFVVKNGRLLTPPTPQELREGSPHKMTDDKRAASGVLPGVTRGAILTIAHREGMAVELAAIDVNLLLDAEEVFVTNSVMGVMPVCRIERHAVGDEKPGELTRRLAALLDESEA